MRILIFAPNYLPATRYGGPVRSTHGLAKGLTELGHSVDVLTTDVDGDDTLDVPLDRSVTIDGVNVHYRPIAAPRRLYRSPALMRLAQELVARSDAVHVNGMFLLPGPAIAGLARREQVPFVVSPRGMLMPDLIAGKSRLVKNAWIKAFELPQLQAAAAIHVTSRAEAEGLRHLPIDPAKVFVIGNGVDSPAAPPASELVGDVWGDIPAGRRVAFLARLDWTKGVDMAIAATVALPDAFIRIAGHDQIGMAATLQSTLRRADGSKVGETIGPLDGDRKWAFLQGADVLLVPSVSESFGMSVVEALAVGTPVIATEGVGAKSLLQRLDPGLVVPREPAALARALGALLADKERRERIGVAARRLVREELSWRSLAGQMAQVYKSAQAG